MLAQSEFYPCTCSLTSLADTCSGELHESPYCSDYNNNIQCNEDRSAFHAALLSCFLSLYNMLTIASALPYSDLNFRIPGRW